VETNQFLHQGQTDTRSFMGTSPRSLHLVKALKKVRNFRSFNPYPSVAYLQFHL
jgi:hypothetical protein